MNKKFRMTIDLTVNGHERITPELIEQVKSENTEDNYGTLDREKLDKLQAILSTILNNENYHAYCIAGAFLFKLTSQGFDAELEELIDPKILDHTLVKAAAELGPEYESFARKLYLAAENETDEDEADEDANDTGDKEKKIIYLHEAGPADMPEEERNLLRAIIQACIHEPKITDAKVVALPEENEEKKQ